MRLIMPRTSKYPREFGAPGHSLHLTDGAGAATSEVETDGKRLESPALQKAAAKMMRGQTCSGD